VDQASDATLVARVVVDDDRGAFAALVNRHQPAVRGLLRRLCAGDAAAADDLAQETFVRAFRGLARFRGGARLSTWLHRIAYNVFLTERTRAATPALAPPDEGRAHDPELRYDVEHAMSALRPPEVAALTLSYVHRCSHEEIADVLGCPVGTVKTHIARGKERLRGLLGDWAAAPRGEAR